MPSTSIRYFKYNEDQKILTVTFTTDKTYKYKNVPQKIYSEMKNAFSKGRFFNFNIRDKYEYEKVGDD